MSNVFLSLSGRAPFPQIAFQQTYAGNHHTRGHAHPIGTQTEKPDEEGGMGREGMWWVVNDFMKYPASMRQSLGTANLHKGFIAAP